MEKTLQNDEDGMIIEVRMFPIGGARCELCSRSAEGDSLLRIRIGKQDFHACPECAHRELLRKYRRLKRRTRELQTAFAEVKYHVLYGSGSEMKEKIIGLCEEYRDRFDVNAEGNLVESGD